jgi:hypothetical protein
MHVSCASLSLYRDSRGQLVKDLCNKETVVKTLFTIVQIATFSVTGVLFAQSEWPTSVPKTETNVEATNNRAPNLEPTVVTNDISSSASFIPGLGNVTSTWANVGSSNFHTKTVLVTGFSFGTIRPAAISCQPRQSSNLEHFFPDVFACQVVTTSNNTIRVRIRRLDAASGWGQNLRLDFIVFSRVNN